MLSEDPVSYSASWMLCTVLFFHRIESIQIHLILRFSDVSGSRRCWCFWILSLGVVPALNGHHIRWGLNLCQLETTLRIPGLECTWKYSIYNGVWWLAARNFQFWKISNLCISFWPQAEKTIFPPGKCCCSSNFGVPGRAPKARKVLL